MSFYGLLQVAARGSPELVSYRNMVALTGIEGVNAQFSSVQLSLTGSKYVQLVTAASASTSHEVLTLSLGCHSSSFESTGATLIPSRLFAQEYRFSTSNDREVIISDVNGDVNQEVEGSNTI